MAIGLARRFWPNLELPVAIDRPSRKVLVAIGSANLRSHRQADRIIDAHDVIVVRCPAAHGGDPASFLRQIADAAVERLHDVTYTALIATGGDTMKAILDRLSIQTFEILQEFEPGFPLGRAQLDDGRSLLVAMKAGGFGDDDTLMRAVWQLRQSASVTGEVSS